MAKAKSKPYPRALLDLMAETSGIILQARTLAGMEMPELALAAWQSAAAREEQVAPLLEALGRDREAAVHRVSAASCYRNAGEPGKAVNLYRAALAGPLLEPTREEVEQLLADCLHQLTRNGPGATTRGPATPSRP